MMKFTPLALALAVAGCSTPQPVVIDNSCILFKPIALNKADTALVIDGTISDDLVDKLLAHNKTGRRHCGW